MWRWAELNDDSKFPYFQIPGYPKKSDTSMGKHIVRYREIIHLHLFGHGTSGDIKTGKSKVDYIALHHFPPSFQPYLNSDVGSRKEFKWRVPIDVGKQCGLTENDLCKTVDELGNRTYYCCPIQRMSESLHEVSEAEERLKIRQQAANARPIDETPVASATSSTFAQARASSASNSKAASTASSAPKSTRKRPANKELERYLDGLMKSVLEKPREFALTHYDLEREVKMLKQTISEQKRVFDDKEQKLRVEMELERDAMA
jgi:hypothetical protein